MSELVITKSLNLWFISLETGDVYLSWVVNMYNSVQAFVHFTAGLEWVLSSNKAFI